MTIIQLNNYSTDNRRDSQLMAADIAGLCEGAKKQGKGFQARCPSHADQTASLTITDGHKKTALYCHAGCNFDDIVKALGITKQDLYPLRTEYKYHDLDGNSAGRKVRTIEGQKYIWQDNKGMGKYPYRANEISKLKPNIEIHLFEGEGVADSAVDINITSATSFPTTGSNCDLSIFKNRRVTIYPDNDKAGFAQAAKRAELLASVCSGVRIATPPLNKPDKWDLADVGDRVERRAVFGRMRDTAKEFSKSEPQVKSKKQGESIIMCAKDIAPVTTDWLINQWLARGETTLLVGKPGMGKTTLAMHIAQLVNQGGFFGNADDSYGVSLGRVLIWSGEDSLPKTLIPRLHAQTSPKEPFVDNIDFITCYKDGDGNVRRFNPAEHLPDIKRHLQAREYKLLIVDPLTAIVGGNPNNSSEVEKAIEPLDQFCREFNISILGISHFRKDSKQVELSLDRIAGSYKWGGFVRTAWAVQPVDGKRVLMRIKNNIGSTRNGFAYTTKLVEVKGIDTKHIKFKFGETIQGDGQEVFTEAVNNAFTSPMDADKKAIYQGKMETAEEWILSQFDDPKYSDGLIFSELKAKATKNDITIQTLRRARDRLKGNGKIRLDSKGRDAKWFKMLQPSLPYR